MDKSIFETDRSLPEVLVEAAELARDIHDRLHLGEKDLAGILMSFMVAEEMTTRLYVLSVQAYAVPWFYEEMTAFFSERSERHDKIGACWTALRDRVELMEFGDPAPNLGDIDTDLFVEGAGWLLASLLGFRFLAERLLEEAQRQSGAVANPG